MSLDYQELELVLCGISEIDVEDWKNSTVVSKDLKDSNVLQWFWEIVADLDAEDKCRLLRFTTGTPLIPAQGFKGLTSYDGKLCNFTLQSVPYKKGIFPRVHVCFNQIDLPLYPTKAQMKKAMQIMIQMDSTGFTTA